MFARLVSAAAPTVGRDGAVTLGRDLMAALIGSAVAGLDPEPAAAERARLVLLRDRLVPAHVEEARFDRMMAGADA